uniref:Eukaryotic translation initiation factor 3, subunit 3 gamma n=1 Tax=Schistosoma japonicum TaxID=6182 RepID=C1LJX2_SCHJA|nr:eukaryotic translation initiation factor 3, subunit 3 gamma [Schistosoma japonicum]
MDYQSKISKPIDTVQVEGKVFLKMIKHYEEESVSSQNFVNGVLLGLAQGSRLEITNCFPLPKTQDDDPNANDALITYEANMIRNLRQVSRDNLTFYFSYKLTISTWDFTKLVLVVFLLIALISKTFINAKVTFPNPCFLLMIRQELVEVKLV